jgi:hypothetical protein
LKFLIFEIFDNKKGKLELQTGNRRLTLFLRGEKLPQVVGLGPEDS